MELHEDVCDTIETENMVIQPNTIVTTTAATNGATRIRAREDDEGDLCLNTIDKDFFPDFAVDGRLWDIWDKIDNHGFVYIHQTSGRPLAIVKTLDKRSHEHNGYCFWFQVILDTVEVKNMELTERDNIKSFLSELDNKYNVLGDWLKDIVDDRPDDISLIPNTEKDDYHEHTILYDLFLSAIGVARVAHEKRPKIVTAKRHINNNIIIEEGEEEEKEEKEEQTEKNDVDIIDIEI